MVIAPVYIPTMLGFVALNFYLSVRASKAHKKPNLKNLKQKSSRVKGTK
jgi:hypothetical protein